MFSFLYSGVLVSITAGSLCTIKISLKTINNGVLDSKISRKEIYPLGTLLKAHEEKCMLVYNCVYIIIMSSAQGITRICNAHHVKHIPIFFKPFQYCAS